MNERHTADAPLISVVVPVYNAEDYVEEAVRSALAAHADLEVVLVEDGSTDGSPDVCCRLAAQRERVRLCRHEGGANRGAGASRNLGILASRGMYVAFLDADDYYLPNRFGIDIVMMEADPDIDGVYGAVATRVEEDGEALPTHDRELITVEPGVGPDELFEAFVGGGRGWFHTAGITVRRRVFDRTGLFSEDLVLAQDWEMWVRMAAVCRLEAGSIREPIAVRRWHGGNRARPDNPLWLEAASARLSSVLSWARRNGLPAGRQRLLRERLVVAVCDNRLASESRVGRGLTILRRLARYGPANPELLPYAAAAVARKLWLRPLGGCPEPEDAPREPPAGGPDVVHGLVSVVVPVYNAESYVAQAVRSVPGTAGQVEVVLVEDGSRDGSLAICRRLAAEEDRVRLLRHPEGENRGPGASRNLGIRAARGEYIAFLDADDYYLPNRFDVDVPMMKADHGIDGVHGMVATRTEDADALPSHDRETIGMAEPVEPGDLFAALLSGDRGWFHTDAITVRRSAFERAGLFSEDLVLSQDWEMWVRLAAVCRIEAGSLDEPVAVRRWHAANRAREDNPQWVDAACARTSSALRWARAQGLPGRQLQLLRQLLVTDVVHRRLVGRSQAGRGLHVLWRTLRYGLRHPWLPLFVAVEVARELCERRPRSRGDAN